MTRSVTEKPRRRGAASRRSLYTIGHSTRSVSEFIEILQAFSVTRLVDIRSISRSRHNPQFNLDVLPAALEGAGIAYVHLAALGGLRPRIKCVKECVNAGWERRPFHNYADYAETAPFREGLRELLEMAARETCAIMCAEVVWWRCHRRIVTDHVLSRGVPVVHLFTRTKGEPASVTSFAVIGSRGRVCYPAPGAGAVALSASRLGSAKTAKGPSVPCRSTPMSRRPGRCSRRPESIRRSTRPPARIG
jgi:hypothetical protein